MPRLKWYKRDPVAALEGMAELTLAERGAYNAILDLIYARDGNLADDDTAVARLIHCGVRDWRRIKAVLIDKGKLSITEGNIHNARADIELAAANVRLASIAKQLQSNSPMGIEQYHGLTRPTSTSRAETVAQTLAPGPMAEGDQVFAFGIPQASLTTAARGDGAKQRARNRTLKNGASAKARAIFDRPNEGSELDSIPARLLTPLIRRTER